MHRLLQRQIKKTVGDEFLSSQPKLLELIELIGSQYEDKDKDKEIALLENALEVSSAELQEANAKVLEQSQRLTNTILDTLSESLIAVDGGLKVVFINPAAKRALEIKGDDVVGKTLLEVICGGQICSLKLQKAIEQNNISVSGKDTFVSAGGRQFPVSFTLNPIGFDLKTHGAVLSFVDIEQKIKDESLLKLQEAALNAAANMIVITDTDGNIEYVNSSFSKFTGYERGEIIGKNASILRSNAHPREFYANMWITAKSGRVWEGEIINRKKDGSLYPEEMTLTPIVNDGKITHFVAIKRDISERKKSEEELKNAMDKALESSRLKSEFLSTMSHEIRTPMNGIIGMTDLLLATELNDEQNEFASIIKDSSNALLTIINDILDFSKIEAGKMDIEVTEFELLPIVESVAELFAVSAKEKKLSLMSYVDPSIKKSLLGDPIRIRQILTNLTGNAMKFTEKGEVVIRVTKSAGDFVKFEIIDSGIGISKESKKRLFQSFTQADGSTTRKYGGTGLGLAISKKLSELMGGSIGLESEIGVGSTFWFEIPLPGAADFEPEQTRECADVKLEGKEVLIVDDSPSALEIVKKYALSWGLKPICADNAKEAIEILDSKKEIDVAVIDMAMPQMNGLELAAYIKSNYQYPIKLLLFTAFDEKEVYKNAIDAPFDGYISKPIKKEGLKNSIVSILSKDGDKKEPFKKRASRGVKSEPTFGEEEQKNGSLLLVEDNGVNQKLALKVLSKLGYSVDISENGKEALEKISTQRFDLVLMDCQMPIMDGFEATAAIRRLGERYSSFNLPIIAMTANAVSGDKERCLAVGMDDYISKPININTLKEKLERWLKRQKPAPAASIDVSHLLEIFGDAGMDTILDILRLSRESTSRILDSIDNALLLDNFEVIYRAGHEMRGECGNIGIKSLEDIAKNIEEAAKDADKPKIEGLTKQARVELEGVTEYINRQKKERENE